MRGVTHLEFFAIGHFPLLAFFRACTIAPTINIPADKGKSKGMGKRQDKGKGEGKGKGKGKGKDKGQGQGLVKSGFIYGIA